MSQHFSKEKVESYLQRTMTPGELLAADDHLSACDACRELLVEARQPEALVANVRALLGEEARTRPRHLAYEELAAYVDDEIGEVEREIADSHLSICGQCKEELRDLFAFKETLSRSPVVEAAPTASPTVREGFLASIRNAFSSRPLQWAGGLAALVMVALAITLWAAWKSSTNDRGSEQVVKTAPTPVMTETPQPPQPTPTASPATPPEQNNNTNVQAPVQTPAPTLQSVEPSRRRTPEVVVPPASSKEIVVALNDGDRRLTLDNQGRMTGLENLSPSEREAVRTALLTGRAPASSELEGLRGRTEEKLMGAPGSAPYFGLQGPVGVVVRSDTPTFRWSALSGADHYVVNVFDSGFNKVLTSGPVNRSEWTTPRSLPRGGVYSWQVTAVVEGKEIQSPVPPAPEARFSILSRAQEDGLSRAEELYKGSHLALGVLYSRAGLLDEAEREFSALLAANPDSAVAKKLLRNIELLNGKK